MAGHPRQLQAAGRAGLSPCCSSPSHAESSRTSASRSGGSTPTRSRPPSRSPPTTRPSRPARTTPTAAGSSTCRWSTTGPRPTCPQAPTRSRQKGKTGRAASASTCRRCALGPAARRSRWRSTIRPRSTWPPTPPTADLAHPPSILDRGCRPQTQHSAKMDMPFFASWRLCVNRQRIPGPASPVPVRQQPSSVTVAAVAGPACSPRPRRSGRGCRGRGTKHAGTPITLRVHAAKWRENRHSIVAPPPKSGEWSEVGANFGMNALGTPGTLNVRAATSPWPHPGLAWPPEPRGR